jgi:hypothetical protein
MKRLLLIPVLLIALSFSSQAQVNLGMVQNNPVQEDTVNYADVVFYNIYVKNYGPDTFNGDITVYTAVDSLGGGGGFNIISMDTSLYNTSNFLPGDSLEVYRNDTIMGPDYHLQRNIVVIWPSAIGTTTLDSVRDSIFVLDPTRVREFVLKSDYIRIYPNPCSDVLNIGQSATGDVLFDEVRIIDISGKEIKKCSFEKMISFKGLTKGTYFLEFRSKEKYMVVKVIKSE